MGPRCNPSDKHYTSRPPARPEMSRAGVDLLDLLNLIHTVEPIPSATVMGAKIGPIPTSKALDKTPGRFRPADYKFSGPRARSWAKNAKKCQTCQNKVYENFETVTLADMD